MLTRAEVVIIVHCLLFDFIKLTAAKMSVTIREIKVQANVMRRVISNLFSPAKTLNQI
jgi:hypothetical protein